MKFMQLFVVTGGMFLLIIAFSCKQQQNNQYKSDTPVSGTIHISVDESFMPVIGEQIRMYELSNPGTRIVASYKPEAECLKDFFRDTANRMVIVTRGLTDKEERFMEDSLGYNPAWNAVATDAVTILVNIGSSDTVFTLERLREQLSGKINRDQTIVFDGLAATSTVRFITDSVLKGKAFDTSVVKAAKSSKEVIEYISSHENAIGLVGINWIGNPEDSWQVEMLKKVKMAYVQCDACEGRPFVRPTQESILSRRYPLVRALYYVLKENYMGLGSGFTSFLKYERGQLIFRRAYLGPVMEFRVRDVNINQTLPKN